VCTIALLHGTHPAIPLIVAANRDEYSARGATPPHVLAAVPRVVGGRDTAEGGTWMGLAEGGLFAALTNQRTFRARDDSRLSRGGVVLELLARRSVPAMEDWLASLDARAYNPFNVVFGRAGELRVAYARPDARDMVIEPLGAGIVVIANDRIGSPEFPRTLRAEALLAPLATAPWADLARELPRVLADHVTPPLDAIAPPPEGSPMTREVLQALQAVCVHTPVYGTRSASIAALAERQVLHYLHADGPPCVTAFADVSALAREA
jgi:uncharacterized protein with NRDE domain